MPETDTLLPERSDTLPAVGDIPGTLRDIRATVDEELGVFRRYFRDSVHSDANLLDKVTRYMLRQKGKEIRPILVLLSAKMCGGITETTYRAAALVELMHTATLVHDDVVDTAERRRSAFSINALWKNKIAVLFGDFLLSRGLLLSLRYGDYEVLHILSDAVRRMSEGELLQIEKTRRLDIDEKTYFRIISDKTASLIAACMGCGALSASADRDILHTMQEAGEHLGLAFQIRDDLFDYGAKDIGKPIGIDLQEKKMTLPLIHALTEAAPKERREILRIVRKKKQNRHDRQAIYAYAERRGGIAYARRKMHEHADTARKLLQDMPPTEARNAMLGLVDYTIQRDK
ncbi:MAG: polyprenyl synthetase family protein [Bacteroidetes bacterium SB0662_bin_6]|nr:polyprenyl synthetase family protein [Bacteroidetes bacterium SB0668_bin_1]MYE03467.1 polyprenyl synthetase family protein [Bacteroidetes bacterium SB0662_bin_6]